MSCGDGTAMRRRSTSSASWPTTARGSTRTASALTVGGGAINNPGRYLVLIPPINGATAFSGTPYFTANPGDPYKAWDMQLTFDFMPSQFITFRSEYNHRARERAVLLRARAA